MVSGFRPTELHGLWSRIGGGGGGGVGAGRGLAGGCHHGLVLRIVQEGIDIMDHQGLIIQGSLMDHGRRLFGGFGGRL